ncbi:MAG: hypothetical protein P8Y97_17735, partial [Candidatus Lokiarchaeota archaeon]
FIFLCAIIASNTNVEQIPYKSSPFQPKPNQDTPDNQDIIDEMRQSKVDQYQANGYFKQSYEPSLRATYYGLYILNTIGRLDVVNQSQITEFIMDHYDQNLGEFSDLYSDRFLDTDFSQDYYPLHTLLETNCYALLSLDILNNLSLINIQASRDFIWDCYNTEEHGFIGLPYHQDLNGNFKTPTADNTYFALITLDMLGQDWNSVSEKKLEIVDFLKSLQVSDDSDPRFGGLRNDKDDSFKSKGISEPNLHSSYYCLKGLQVFGYQNIIDQDAFYSFLGYLYNSDEFYFKPSILNDYTEYLNIPSSAIGLELAELTNYVSYNYYGTLNFLLNNRNEWGMWDASTDERGNHELIDTFQVVRSLNILGLMNQFSPLDKDELAQGTLRFLQYNGFSLLSEDYMSMEVINSIAKSFTLYDEISQLDANTLYNQIREAYFENGDHSLCFFYAYTNTEGNYEFLRSTPIEYFTSGKHEKSSYLNLKFSHKSTFEALNSLYLLDKLDDFEMLHNLTYILTNIIDSQFLEEGYSNFGGFLPTTNLRTKPLNLQNENIFLKYTYYAVRTIKLLSDYLGLQFSDLPFDSEALYTYISRNVIETGTQQYLNSIIDDTPANLIENTYYAAYILNLLDLNDFKSKKVRQFLLTSIDYTDLKSIYYSYKLSTLMRLDIEFNVKLTHPLIKTLYNPTLSEVFQTTDHSYIDQRALYWLSDMAVNDRVRINPAFPNSVTLGSNFNISATLCNIILEEFGPYTILKFESEQLGTYVLEHQPDNSFRKEIFIPIVPSNYPELHGHLVLYDGSSVKTNISISFNTTIELQYTSSIQNGSSYTFTVRGSLIIDSAKIPLHFTKAYVKVYIEGNYNDTFSLNPAEKIEYVIFTKSIEIDPTKHYYFELYLDSDFCATPIFLENATYIPNTDPGDPVDNSNTPKNLSAKDPIVFGFIPGTMIFSGTAGIVGFTLATSSRATS